MTALIISEHPFGWDILHEIPGLDQEILIVTTAVHERLIVDLVQYLDAAFSPGILKEWTSRYVSCIATPILAQAIPPEETSMWEALKDPYGYFETSDGDFARYSAIQRVCRYVPCDAPEFLKQAVLAHMEFGCGNYREAMKRTQICLCEWRSGNSLPDCFDWGNQETILTLLSAECIGATILLSFLKENAWCSS